MRGYTQIFLVFFFVYCAPTLANICPHGWSGLLPDPEDCGKFYQCSHGFPYSFNCSGDLHFNPSLLVCDWPANAGCVVSTTTISTPAPSPSTTAAPSPTPPPTTTQITTAPPPEKPTRPPPLPPSPTAPPTSTAPPPPPEESTTSSPVLTTTTPSTTAAPSSPLPPSSTAPPTTQPPTTEEEEEELITEAPPTEPPQEDDDEEDETTPFPETTLPDDIIPTTFPPEFEGSGEWESSGSGDDDFTVRCPARNPGADIFLPDARDCNAFYYCSWGVAVPQHCPSGLHWSVRSSECATPSEADCSF